MYYVGLLYTFIILIIEHGKSIILFNICYDISKLQQLYR